MPELLNTRIQYDSCTLSKSMQLPVAFTARPYR